MYIYYNEEARGSDRLVRRISSRLETESRIPCLAEGLNAEIHRKSPEKILLYLTDASGKGKPIFVKIWRDKGLIRKLKNVCRSRENRALREVDGWRRLRSAHLRTPKVLAWGLVYRKFLWVDGFLITEEVASALTLDHTIYKLKKQKDTDNTDIGSQIDSLLLHLAHDLVRLHTKGFLYGDLHFQNILVTRPSANKDWLLYYVDWTGVRSLSSLRDGIYDVAYLVYSTWAWQVGKWILNPRFSRHLIQAYFDELAQRGEMMFVDFEHFKGSVLCNMLRIQRTFQVRRIRRRAFHRRASSSRSFYPLSKSDLFRAFCGPDAWPNVPEYQPDE